MSREGALWIGGLEPYMDEDFLKMSLSLMGEDGVQSIKVIKNKFTGEPASYGFINFESDPAALMAMHKLNGKIMPNSQPPVRWKLNHNSTRLMPGEKDHSIWVGDLTPDVDDLQLYKFFSQRFQTVRSAKVVLDNAGFSKGYGFIRFGDEQEQQTALISMMGLTGLGGKGLKVSIAVPKSKMEGAVSAHDVQQRFPSSLQSASVGVGISGVAGGGGSSIADNIPTAALAVMVSNASGNPNAGAAVVAEAQNQEYQQYWHNYQQQMYWSQYAAWNQYQQQYGQYAQQQQQGQDGSAEAYEETPVRPGKGESIFDGDELDLIEHTFVPDVDEENAAFLERSEELWEGLSASLWWKPADEAWPRAADETDKHTVANAPASTALASRAKAKS